MKRQQLLDGAAMIGDSGGHGRRPRDSPPADHRCSQAETRVRRTEVVDGADYVHPVLQGQGAARQCPASARQRRQALTECRVQSLDVRGVDHACPLRATLERLDACRRPGDDPTLDGDDAPLRIALHDLGDADMAPGTQPGASVRSCMLWITKRLPNRPDIGDAPVGTEQQRSVRRTSAHPLDEAMNQGEVAVCAHLARQPQTGADPHRQGHPHDTPLGLDADLVALHLPQVTGVLDQMLLHGLAVDASACPPTRHRPLVEAERDNDGLQRTAMCQQRDHQAHRLGRGPQALQRRAFCSRERLMARRAEEPLVLARVEAHIALAGLASGGALQIGAEYDGGVHDSPPGFAWEHTKRSMSDPPFS
jgi:hypothetical protein